MPALLPMGDESPMNLEGVYVSFWTLFFAATFLRLGSELPRNPILSTSVNKGKTMGRGS
jgi:hypothetical protein